jgi:hypothetical protein
MNKSESIKEITQAIIKVMADVKGIEKSLTVGTGSNSYKGVADQDVKKIVGESMEKNGLAILPIGIDENTKVDNWDETGGQYGPKRKQLVFTKVTTTYLLCHISGEWVELKGYGHGVDSQDKSAGKATTYALKYALLYTFLVPTGKIDDTDLVHSEEEKITTTMIMSADELVRTSTLPEDKKTNADKALSDPDLTLAEYTAIVNALRQNQPKKY